MMVLLASMFTGLMQASDASKMNGENNSHYIPHDVEVTSPFLKLRDGSRLIPQEVSPDRQRVLDQKRDNEVRTLGCCLACFFATCCFIDLDVKNGSNLQVPNKPKMF